MAVQRVRPEFVATNIITNEDRAARVVLEANSDHNTPGAVLLAGESSTAWSVRPTDGGCRAS